MRKVGVPTLVLLGAVLLAGPRGSVAATHAVLTRADARRVEAAALRSRFTREIAAGGSLGVARVVPSVSTGGKSLLGGVAYVRISPPVSFEDQKVPVTISPDAKAPPGTPTLHRYARMSASNVGELEVAISLSSGSAVRIEPTGSGYRVTKLELIGPAPTNPAYAPEPGE